VHLSLAAYTPLGDTAVSSQEYESHFFDNSKCITCSTTTNIHLADKATQVWRTIRPSTRFGSTHHTHTPTQWALQALSLNISHALATALTTALQDRPSTATASNRPAPPAFRYPTPFAYRHRSSPLQYCGIATRSLRTRQSSNLVTRAALKGLTDGQSFEFGGLSASQADSSQESQRPKHASRITSPTMIRHTLLPFEQRLHPLP
jgi:hypothetical protein